MWNASGVHKQSPKVWQEKLDGQGKKNQCRRILSLSLQKATVPSDEIGSSSDCENRTMVWNHLEQSSKEGPDGTENRLGGSWVSHVPWQSNVSKRVQVRPGDQPGYPKDTIESFVGHSSMGLLCPPANIVQNLEDTNQTINQTKGSFTSVQMVHTHTCSTSSGPSRWGRLYSSSSFLITDTNMISEKFFVAFSMHCHQFRVSNSWGICTSPRLCSWRLSTWMSVLERCDMDVTWWHDSGWICLHLLAWNK